MVTQLMLALLTTPQGGSLAFNLVDIYGKSIPLAKPSGATVLVFVNRECPISRAFQPEIARIQKRFVKAGVTFVGVYTDTDITNDLAAKNAKEFHAGYSIVLDPHHVLARDYGARVTPECVVLNFKMQTTYRGRINDLFAGLGNRRQKATTNELESALSETLAGKWPKLAYVAAVGCVIQ